MEAELRLQPHRGNFMAKRIHPAFKHFILGDALNKWDKILRETYGGHVNLNSGVCFRTSNTFCNILSAEFNIPCELELVASLVGNKSALTKMQEPQYDLKKLFDEANRAIVEKGKDNLSEQDVVLMGLGISDDWDDPSSYHFIMKFPEQGEVADLTIARMNRPKWGIKCNNYWTKYDRKLEERGIIHSREIVQLSGCIIQTDKKHNKPRVMVDPEKYTTGEKTLKGYIREQVHKRNIPVFMR